MMNDERDYPCKYGHNNCAIKDGGNCFDEMEHAAYIEEFEAHRKQTIKNECQNGRHTWWHYYGYVKCATCHEMIDH